MNDERKNPASLAGRAARKPSVREREWEINAPRPTLDKSPERAMEFTTISGHPIRRLYTPAGSFHLGSGS